MNSKILSRNTRQCPKEIEGLLYERLSGDRAICYICQRQCLLRDGQRGYCGVRVNRHGKIFLTTYGMVSSWRKAPIEIKPVYHYLPGSYAFSLGSIGCNFMCPGCQNWEISFALKTGEIPSCHYLPPNKAIQLARQLDCQGISWTYNEPTLWFEYTLDSARLAKKDGLYTNYVTNGFMSQEALHLIGPYLDIFRVDIKGFSRKAYGRIAHIPRWEGILDIVKQAKHRWHMHVEVVTNIIPGINDDPGELRELATWICQQLGSDTPWHLTRFFPRWKWNKLSPTPTATLESARRIAQQAGLQYVYIGNMPGHPANHTYCPQCGTLLIRRDDWEEVQIFLQGNRCPKCQQSIPGVFGQPGHSRKS